VSNALGVGESADAGSPGDTDAFVGVDADGDVAVAVHAEVGVEADVTVHVGVGVEVGVQVNIGVVVGEGTGVQVNMGVVVGTGEGDGVRVGVDVAVGRGVNDGDHAAWGVLDGVSVGAGNGVSDGAGVAVGIGGGERTGGAAVPDAVATIGGGTTVATWVGTLGVGALKRPRTSISRDVPTAAAMQRIPPATAIGTIHAGRILLAPPPRGVAAADCCPGRTPSDGTPADAAAADGSFICARRGTVSPSTEDVAPNHTSR
jgi:hypothetical protein